MIKVILDKYALAQAFSAKVRKLSKFQEIIKRNKTRTDPDICHSHDFCDANELMLEAWSETFKVEPNFGYDPHLKLIGDAWSIAKENEFFHAYPERFSNLAKEFPDFDLFTLPVIPAGWEDISWHNDSCPCLEISKDEETGNRIYLFVDFADPAKREVPESENRFSLYSEVYEDEECDCTMIIETNDFDAVLKAVKKVMKKAA